MKLEEGNAWGILSGKISTTPQQALDTWGFVQDPDAKGIIFRIYTVPGSSGTMKKECRIANYRPPANPQTAGQTKNRNKFTWLIRTAAAHRNNLTLPIWEPQARKNIRTLDHQNLWMSINMLRMQSADDYGNLQISRGDLEGAELTGLVKAGVNSWEFTWNTNCLTNGDGNDIPHAYLIDTETGVLHQGLPTGTPVRSDGTHTYEFLGEFNSVVGYLFFQRGEMYSQSTVKEVILVLTYVDIITIYSLSSPSASWNDWDLSSIIPENCIYVEIQAYNTLTSAAYLAGVRHIGSSDNRYINLGPMESVTWRVKPDDARKIQRYSGTNNIYWYVVGYLYYT